MENNNIDSDFYIDDSSIKKEWNHKGCYECRENKRYGHIVTKKCQIHYKGECIVLTMNKALRNSSFNHYNLFYLLMNEVIKPILTEFTFHWEGRLDGRFYITNKKGDLLYLYWRNDIYGSYYIGGASFSPER